MCTCVHKIKKNNFEKGFLQSCKIILYNKLHHFDKEKCVVKE